MDQDYSSQWTTEEAPERTLLPPILTGVLTASALAAFVLATSCPHSRISDGTSTGVAILSSTRGARADGTACRDYADGSRDRSARTMTRERLQERRLPVWCEIAVIIGAGVVAAFQAGKAPIAIPLLRAELGLSLTEVSWVLSLFAVLGTDQRSWSG